MIGRGRPRSFVEPAPRQPVDRGTDRIRGVPGRSVRLLAAGWLAFRVAAAGAEADRPDPATVLWYTHPAQKWENALPVGNGRLGAMVFGETDEERIQLNEDTLWSGGPYSSVVKGGAAALPEIQKLVFEGKWRQAHKAFGRSLMGYPVEQMKYQSLGDLVLAFPDAEATRGLSPRARSRRGRRDRRLHAGRRAVPPRGLREPRGPGHRRPADRGPAREHLLQGAAARRAQRRPFELRHRVLPHGRLRQRRPRPAPASPRTTSASRAGCATRRGSRSFPKAGACGSTRRTSSSKTPTP